MDKLLFGTAGIPILTIPRNTVAGIWQVAKLGLGAMELEFVQNVNVSSELAPLVKKAALDYKVELTCHGSYFVNLNAAELLKVNQSIARIEMGAKRLYECGGKSIVFHAAFYLKDEKQKVFERVEKNLKKVSKNLNDLGVQVKIRPETTGKETQFGTLDEILRLSESVENVMPCIDFSHLHARSNGKENTFEEFSTSLEKVEKTLGKDGLHNLHCHVSGIEYTAKGERKHLNLQESDFRYLELLKAL